MRVSRAGLQPHDRPLGVFLLVGPTGVGKTQLCKALARQLFDTEEAVTRLDMSEYSEKLPSRRLIGAPPGYVGYDEGGQLTEAVRRKPYSVVLLDEFEKAHREVATLLLQVMDDGHLTDSHGQKVDFRSSLLVLTSNLGAQALAELEEGRSIGGGAPAGAEAVSKALPPEFVNRLDQIVLFNRLPRAEIGKIALLELDKVRGRLARGSCASTSRAAPSSGSPRPATIPMYGARRRPRRAAAPAEPDGQGAHRLRRRSAAPTACTSSLRAGASARAAEAARSTGCSMRLRVSASVAGPTAASSLVPDKEDTPPSEAGNWSSIAPASATTAGNRSTSAWILRRDKRLSILGHPV